MFVGTSGFSYPGWKGRFYPSDLKSEDFLAFYAKKLNTVEINSSFYAPPNQVMVKSWSKKTGDEFKFAFKAPRQITHISKLDGPEAYAATDRLNTTLELLGSKKGPVLFQLPPYLRLNLEKLEKFLNNTQALKKRVFEFRHESWLNEEAYKLLDRYNAGFCIAETEDMQPVLRTTGDLAYFRLRKDKYDLERMEEWSEIVEKTAKGLGETYVFLRHDETGENAGYALKMLERSKKE